jgi:PAS domain-containing protein
VLALDDVENLTGGSSQADAELGQQLAVRGLITVPLVRENRLQAMLFVHEPQPRAWKRAEAAIARDVAERSWAALQRAQAEQSLRISEDHYRHAVELNPQVSWTALPDGQLNRVARRWHDWTGTTGLGESWAGGLHPEDREATFVAGAIRSRPASLTTSSTASRCCAAVIAGRARVPFRVATSRAPSSIGTARPKTSMNASSPRTGSGS